MYVFIFSATAKIEKKTLQNNFLYSINLFFTIFIMVDKFFSEKHTETTRPHMRTFDTAKESLDPILSLK